MRADAISAFAPPTEALAKETTESGVSKVAESLGCRAKSAGTERAPDKDLTTTDSFTDEE